MVSALRETHNNLESVWIIIVKLGGCVETTTGSSLTDVSAIVRSLPFMHVHRYRFSAQKRVKLVTVEEEWGFICFSW